MNHERLSRFVVCLIWMIVILTFVKIIAKGNEHEDHFIAKVRDFVKAAETYVAAIGQSDQEQLGKVALRVWANIPSPSKDLPNTKDIRRIRGPVNSLAKLIGGQMLDIANEGHILAEGLQKRLTQNQLAQVKRELK